MDATAVLRLKLTLQFMKGPIQVKNHINAPIVKEPLQLEGT